ncbi:MAG TPA: UxaA family hydrolase [Chloroflexota bacterium]|nr:UxaA family hydrolase [Chloroflexota bacterium]
MAVSDEKTAPRVVQRMSPTDNVATALRQLEPGMRVTVGGVAVTVVSQIPFGHKIALSAIAAGSPVLKYGEAIGLARDGIAPGEHVHTHNVDSQRGRGDLQQ